MGKLTKLLVDKMASWWNGKLIKVNEMSKLTKLLVDKMASWQNC